jgi:hypothetical protein
VDGQCRYCRAALPQATPQGVKLTSPADITDFLADKDGDGMPDIVQQMLATGAVQNVQHSVRVSSQTVVMHSDGRIETLDSTGNAAAAAPFDVVGMVTELRKPPPPAASSRGTLIGLGVVLVLAVAVACFLLASS